MSWNKIYGKDEQMAGLSLKLWHMIVLNDPINQREQDLGRLWVVGSP